MSKVLNTRLRWVRSKKLDELILWVNRLPYKVEIKGNPVKDGKKWVLFYIIPDDIIKEVPHGDI